MKKSLISKFINTLLYAILIAIVPILYGADPTTAIVSSYVGVEVLSVILPQHIIGVDAYADTVLLAARAFIKDENNRKFQSRPNNTRIIDLFMKDREFTIPSLATLRKADTQATDALYLKNKDFTLITEKSCDPTGEQSGSAKVPLTFQTIGFEIRSSFKQHSGNEVSQAQAFANDLWNAEKTLFFGTNGSVDAILLAFLETNKSGVNAGGSGDFDGGNDIMAIDPADNNDFYNLVTADMELNNYNPTYVDVHDTMWTAKQRKYVNQGGGNSVNLAFQFAGFEFLSSNLIATGTIGANDYNSIHYIVPEQGVAIVDWNDPINRLGKVSGNESWFTAQSLLMPGLTFDVFKKTGCSDTSADGGGKQDLVDIYEFTLHFAPAIQPTDDGGTPVFKYGTLDAAFV